MSPPDPIPAQAEALFYEGVRRMNAGDAQGAQDSLAASLQVWPGLAEAHVNLGLLHQRVGDADAALAALRRAVFLNPALAQAQLNLGMVAMQQKHSEEARLAFEAAATLSPQDPAAWSNLCALHACLGQDAQAEAAGRHALALNPDHTKARFNLSYVLLRQGRFDEGWPLFEARDWYAALAARLPCPRWRGQALDGVSLLITYEAGHGDMIQFVRYAALLKDRGARRLTLLCHPALKRLFERVRALDSVVGFDETLPEAEWDGWTPLLSLPFHCGTRLDNMPATLPYLQSCPELKAQWRLQLAGSPVPGSGPRPRHRLVGLAWRGNPKFENDDQRSLPGLHTLAPLGRVEGIRFVPLQKGVGEDEARHPPSELNMPPLSRPLDDFLDTASLIDSLDLVISVDTAAAHLAGALGKPCWLLLPAYMPDWRWLLEREDSPWYPGVMQLFRQTSAGLWDPVVAQVQARLQAWASDAAP